MPPTKQTAVDILRRHESRIRELYMTHSIKTVKTIMESEEDLPEFE